MTDDFVEQDDETATSTSLLKRSVAKDAAAWGRLVDLYGPFVYEWCRRWGLQPCDAENVGQETFLKVAQNLANFRRDAAGDTFRGWLYRIARNSFIDHMRRQGREAAAGGSDAQRCFQSLAAAPVEEEAAPSEHEISALYRKALELVRSEFSERDWQIVAELMEGKQPQDVGGAFGVSMNVVYLAKSRILRRLRQEFAELLPEVPSQRRPEP